MTARQRRSKRRLKRAASKQARHEHKPNTPARKRMIFVGNPSGDSWVRRGFGLSPE